MKRASSNIERKSDVNGRTKPLIKFEKVMTSLDDNSKEHNRNISLDLKDIKKHTDYSVDKILNIFPELQEHDMVEELSKAFMQLKVANQKLQQLIDHLDSTEKNIYPKNK